mmetsp:Transcript_4/g.6  ORF Transcript_4/g.6 Transcript_4/m.6 type:complete len:88 (-) Transcript_4:1430-1693(-)
MAQRQYAATHNLVGHTVDLTHVESKIKGEVNYHKELSKQYNKMKTNLRSYNHYTDDYADYPRDDPMRDKFVLVERDEDYRREKALLT